MNSINIQIFEREWEYNALWLGQEYILEMIYVPER